MKARGINHAESVRPVTASSERGWRQKMVGKLWLRRGFKVKGKSGKIINDQSKKLERYSYCLMDFKL